MPNPDQYHAALRARPCAPCGPRCFASTRGDALREEIVANETPLILVGPSGKEVGAVGLNMG